MPPYKTSTYMKPMHSQTLLTFTKPKKKEPSLFLTTVLKTHTDPHSSVKFKQQSLGTSIVISPSNLSKAEYAAKIKASSQNLKKKYDEILKSKSCSQTISMEDRPQIIMSLTQPVCKKQPTKKQTSKSKATCSSTLKSGKPCTAKSKDGSKFCGRHGA